MTQFEKFLELNKIKKKDIAAYLGILPTNIAAYCKEGSRLPEKHIKALKANTLGWNTAPLDQEPEYAPRQYAAKMSDLIKENSALRSEVKHLNLVVSRLSAVVSSYEAMIHNLVKADKE